MIAYAKIRFTFLLSSLLGLLLLILMVPAFAADNASTSVNISSTSLGTANSGAVMLSLDIAPPANWGASTILVHYDPAMVEPTGCTLETGILGACNISYVDILGADAVRLSVASSDGITQNTDIASIQFSKLSTAASGQVIVSPQIVTLASWDGVTMTAQTNSGSISWGQNKHHVFLPVLVR